MLIKSVIASTTNFWCSAFCLPQACMDAIDSMCSAFLWSGSPNDTSKAKVAWKEVCNPMQEGGLGIRSITEVAKVFSLRLIWRIFNESQSLWVDWVRHFLLRSESFWDIRDTGLGSWVWRKMLKMRTLAKQFLRMEIHNGQSTRFWTNIWHPSGRLIEVAGESGTQKLGISRSALVCEVRTQTCWAFRRTRDRLLREIISSIETHQLSDARNSRDIVLWRKNENEFCNQFSTS